jgi:hypothetical protein
LKILRSVTRRGYSVGSAGWFAILKPNTWFPATRLPVPFRYRGSQSAQTAALHQQGTLPPKIMTLSTLDRGLLRPALAVVAAIGITAVLLWWITNP